MNNNHVEDGVLLRAIDQELAPRQTGQVKQHLEACPFCRERLERLRRITARIAEHEHDGLEAGPAAAQAERERFLARLDQEPERQSRRPRWLPWVLAPAAVSLGVLVCLALWTTRHPRPVAVQAIRSKPAEVAPVITKKSATPVKPAGVYRTAKKRAHPERAVAAAAPAEIATPFFALPFSDASLPLAQATVIRVELPRSALALTGLPVDEDRRNERVDADLVVGADGLARAIRFVRLVRSKGK
jgi:anti-sigma factor RsiW